MAPIEFYRYTESRGDTVIYKFDMDVIQNPSHYPANDSPISVYHHYRVNYHHKYLLHSDLLPEELAIERWHRDQQPKSNLVMHKEVSQRGGMFVRTSYVWMGWQWDNNGVKGYKKLEEIQRLWQRLKS